jgi:hypothetical protein
MAIAQLTVSSLLGFNAGLGQSLNLRGRKTVNQGSIMTRMLRLARNRWSRHFEKRKEGRRRRRRSGDQSGQGRQTGTNRLSVNSACVQSLSWRCKIRVTYNQQDARFTSVTITDWNQRCSPCCRLVLYSRHLAHSRTSGSDALLLSPKSADLPDP